MSAATEENLLWSKSATTVVVGSLGISPLKELLRRSTTTSDRHSYLGGAMRVGPPVKEKEPSGQAEEPRVPIYPP
jgi:hypothetical protein